MANWLDKYDAPKAENGIEGTMGGLTDVGFNYNGAWGGTMQAGGFLPGATGRMYARYNEGGLIPGDVGFSYPRTKGIPDNGPNAKKTKARAQNGMEMKYYQEGLDFKPKTISKYGSKISQAQDGLTIEDLVKATKTKATSDNTNSGIKSKVANQIGAQKASNQKAEQKVKTLVDKGGYSEVHARRAVRNKEEKANSILEKVNSDNYRIQMHPDFDPNKSTDEQSYLLNDNSLRTRLLRGSNMLTNAGNPVGDIAAGILTSPGRSFANLTMDADNRYFNSNNTGLGNFANFAEDIVNVAPSLIPKAAGALGKVPSAVTQGVRSAGNTMGPFYGKDLKAFIRKKIGKQLNEKLPTGTPLSTRALASDATITEEGNRILNRLASPEGKKRLKNQFKLADPELNNQQLEYLTATRLNEINTAVNYNKSRFYLDYGKGAPGTPTQNVPFMEYLPMQNAHFSEINLFPGIRKLDAPVDLFPRRATPPPPPNVSSGRFSLAKPTASDNLKAFADPNYRPGSIALGTGLELNKNVLAHEVMHAIQNKGVTPVDVDLLNLLKPKNTADMLWRAGARIDPELKADLRYFTTSGGRNAKSEPLAFLEELRNRMLNRGIIKDDYEKITPRKLAKARLDAVRQVDENFVEGTRLIKFTPPWKYGKLADIMNVAPATVPVVGAAALLGDEEQPPKQKEGGEVKKDDMGYWNPENWGEPVEIGSNEITMQGVYEPLLGISDTGDTQMMYPGEDYEFDGDTVTEYPMAQNGKNLKPLVDEQLEYIQSPLYRERLTKLGIKEPETVAADRANYLKKLEFQTASSGPISGGGFGQNQTKSAYREGQEYPVIFLEKGATEGTAAHEIGHVTSGVGTSKVTSPYKATYNQLSPSESFLFYNRNKNLKPILKKVYEAYKPYNSQRLSYYSSDIVADKFAAANESELSYKPDPHDVGSGEAYGDLSAIRHFLKKEGITKSYGETITPELWKKALQNKKLLNEEHFKRMRKNYDDDAIILLNNKIAQNKSSIGDDYAFDGKTVREYQMAKSGISVNNADAQPIEKLDQLLNFTNYNKPTKGGWLDKYQ